MPERDSQQTDIQHHTDQSPAADRRKALNEADGVLHLNPMAGVLLLMLVQPNFVDGAGDDEKSGDQTGDQTAQDCPAKWDVRLASTRQAQRHWNQCQESGHGA